MTTPVFIVPCGWDALGASKRRAIERLATGDSVWVAPTEGARPVGFRYEPLRHLRPLELWAPWLLDIDSPLLVAAHPTAEPVAVSRRYPIALIDTSERSEDDRLMALAMRSSAIAVPADHPLALAVDGDRLIDIEAEAQSWPDVSAHADRSPYHEVLSAELFNRFEKAREQLEYLDFLGPYRRAHTVRRLSEPDDRAELLDVHLADEGDLRGAALAAQARGEAGGYQLGPEHGLIATIVGLGEITAPSELAQHAFAMDPASPEWARRILLTQFLLLLESVDDVEPALQANVVSLLKLLEDVSRLSVAQVSAIGRLDGAQDVLRKVSETGSHFSAMAARQELQRLDFHAGRHVDEVGIRNDVAEIDSQSWHEGLWQAGPAYWGRLSTDAWQRYLPADKAPPPVASPSGQTNLEIAELDRTARELLASGDAARAAELFDRVRAESLATEPPSLTAEIAARLNQAVAMDQDGQDPALSKALILSAIDDVRPALDLVQLRDRRLALLAEVEADENRSARFAASIAYEAERGRPPSELVTLIDDLALHPGLWKSASRYWEQAAESPWTGQETRPPEPPSRSLPGPIGWHQGLGRVLLRARRWRLAAWWYSQLRKRASSHQPPLVTAEQAARVNAGWALSRSGGDPAKWQQLIGSVLTEVGPEATLVTLRADLVARMTNERSS